MKTHNTMKQLAASILLATMFLASADAQTTIEWNVANGDYTADLNWNPDFVPSATFDETASINNTGLAFIAGQAPSPFALLIGRSNAGQLEIRSGGSIEILALQGMANNGGNTEVGQNNGVGQLTVLPGGSLTTSSLRVAGRDTSNVTLGGAGAGTSALTVQGSTNLRASATIIGTNVDFSTDDLTLSSGNQLNLEIGSGGIAAIDVANNASLRGTLNVAFDGFTPSVGDTWDIIDASSISGQFGSLQAPSLTESGLGLVVSNVAGGSNGMVAQLGLEAQLVMTVDRGSGAVTIENRAAGSDVLIDGYGVLSPEGALNTSNWASFESAGVAGWAADQSPTNQHLGETALQGSRTLAGDSDVSLGELYAFTPAALGEPFPALEFEYRLASGGVRTGVVEMIGPDNDVVLTVDPETGVSTIQNQSAFDLVIDAYGVLSESGSLDTDGWASFQDAGVSDWLEANPADNHLGETNIAGTLSLNAQSDPFPLGALFDADSQDAVRDLVFEYRLDTGEIRNGTVHYGDPVVFEGGPQICGDFDGDGDVDTADRTIQTTNWTGALQPGDPNATKTFAQGDCDGDGDVDTADQNGLIQNWTGAQQNPAGNLEDGGDADLVYDPTTGNVTLDAKHDTASGVFISFVMATGQNNMVPDNLTKSADGSAGPFFDVGTNTDATTFQIGQTDPLNQGAGPDIDLGDIFPAGMDLDGLSEYLTLADYASALGEGGTLDLIVVPEPTSLVLALLGFLGVIRRRRTLPMHCN